MLTVKDSKHHYQHVRRARHCRPGIISIWTALLGLFLIGMVGLAIDVAYSLLAAHQLQNAADAAALAGAQKVRLDIAETRQAALNVAQANHAAGQSVLLTDNADNAADGDIVIGRFNRAMRQFTPTLRAPNAVKVVARRTNSSLSGPVQLFFGSVFGVTEVQITRDAIAMIGGGTGAGIIALDMSEKNGLRIDGNVTVHTGEGSIQVNSHHAGSALFIHGNPVINAPVINVCGMPRLVGDVEYSGVVNSPAPPLPDPLAEVPAPTWNPAEDLGTVSITGGATLQIDPGYYSGGISINNGALTLAPGIYILDGAGLNVTGNATFVAEGVMFYIIGTGVVDLTGTNAVRITPPDPDLYDYPGVDTYEQISIFQARDNTNPSRIIGTSLMDLQGTLYFPATHLEIGGTCESLGNQLIANTIHIHGDGELLIRYKGKEPAVGHTVFLVE